MLTAEGWGSNLLNDDLSGFLQSQRHVCSTDAVLHGVPEWRVLDDPDQSSPDEAHVQESSSKRAFALDVDHHRGLAGTQSCE